MYDSRAESFIARETMSWRSLGECPLCDRERETFVGKRRKPVPDKTLVAPLYFSNSYGHFTQKRPRRNLFNRCSEW